MLKRILVILVALSFSAYANQNFDYAVKHLFEFEGGDKIDKSIGSLHSRYGITIPTLKRYNKNLTLYTITEDQAKDLVYKLYWLEYGLDRFMDKRVALLIMDLLYNSNPTNAIKVIEKAIGGKKDGKLSVSEVAKINYMGYKTFAPIYVNARLNYLKSLKIWNRFGKGLGRRVNALGNL